MRTPWPDHLGPHFVQQLHCALTTVSIYGSCFWRVDETHTNNLCSARIKSRFNIAPAFNCLEANTNPACTLCLHAKALNVLLFPIIAIKSPKGKKM